MWSARQGHLECALVLAQWSTESLRRRDANGQTAVQIAATGRYTEMAAELEKIQLGARPLSIRTTHLGMGNDEQTFFTSSKT